MKPCLLDLNLLVALAWPSHVHHRAAHLWFSKNSHRGWATCPLTQCGFVRVSWNPAIVKEAVSPQEALAVLRKITALKHHIFWPDDQNLATSPHVPSSLLAGHRQVTDAYLLGLAISRGGRLATPDRSVTALLPSGSPHADFVEMVPVE